MERTFARSWQLQAKAERERRRRQQTNIKNRIPQYVFRGGAAALFQERRREVILAGPSETGKTIASLQYLDTLARTYARSTGVIVRKVRSDMAATVLKIFKRAFVDPAGDIRIFGGENVEFFEYPNGTRIWVAGIDRPGKVLSGELDFAYANQTEELALEDWEYLSTRTTGRAGVLVPGILFGDCNPGPPNHWILEREKTGRLVKLESRHEDNPRLYEISTAPDGSAQFVLTAAGVETMKTLDALTGVRKERLRWGRWVSAEGIVYEEFDPARNVIEVMPHGWEAWRKIRSIDFGYSNPFSCSWWAIDPDGRMVQYRQIYMTGRTVRTHAAQINELSRGETYEATICDHDAEDRATLNECGIGNIPARKEISIGIDKVKERLVVAGDGKPRLYFLRGALVERDETLAEKKLPLCTTDELSVYMYPKGVDGKPVKEVPLDLNNHGCDEMRYAVRYVDANLTGQLFY